MVPSKAILESSPSYLGTFLAQVFIVPPVTEEVRAGNRKVAGEA